MSAHFARLATTAPECPADLDCSGGVDSGDFFGYLDAFFAAAPPSIADSTLTAS